jgi:hypothetical protein
MAALIGSNRWIVWACSSCGSALIKVLFCGIAFQMEKVAELFCRSSYLKGENFGEKLFWEWAKIQIHELYGFSIGFCNQFSLKSLLSVSPYHFRNSFFFQGVFCPDKHRVGAIAWPCEERYLGFSYFAMLPTQFLGRINTHWNQFGTAGWFQQTIGACYCFIETDAASFWIPWNSP